MSAEQSRLARVRYLVQQAAKSIAELTKELGE